MNKIVKIDLKSLKAPLIFMILATILVSAVSFYVYINKTNSDWNAALEEEQARVESVEAFMYKALQVVENDLEVTANNEELNDYLRYGDKKFIEGAAEDFLDLSKAKGIYDQIRFLDEEGMEIVRVKYNSGIPDIVAEAELQDKSGRYYFQDALALERGETFVSPFDLNIENGEIQQPETPIIRFGKSIITSSGNKQGVIILNYLGDVLLQGMDEIYRNSDGTLLMLNQNGNWLKAENSNAEWNFMYDDKAEETLYSIDPEAWIASQEALSGQRVTDMGVYTFIKIFPLSLDQVSSSGSIEPASPSDKEVLLNEYNWTILSYISAETLKEKSTVFRERMIILDLIIILMFGLVTWRYAYALAARKEAEIELKEVEEKPLAE